jgi:protein-S-isoprenylcysteine O-methyltransferase Ste14
MNREITLWGVGPSIIAAAGVYAVVAAAATWLWPETCIVRSIPHTVFVAIGTLCLLVGLPMLAVAGRAATIAYRSDQLATTGIFGIVRNPIYSAWIVFIIPGLVLMSRSWPVFLTPVVAYVVFKLKISRETEYLERRFGAAFLKYRAETPELFPRSRFRRRR